ncbi:MAG: undecaprenyldiphospho-muramoylpentapeptide beta-N-acetylglucosaminyltransferase [Eubacteriales bacterium]
MKSIVLTGGGTAGHVTPNLALIPLLRDKGFRIHYIGSHDGMEKDIISGKKHVHYYSISSGKLRRYFDMKNFTDPFRIIKGYFDARKILKQVKPSVVFSKGGFVTVPVVIAAKSLKIPVVIHESDFTSGLANKIALPFATTMCTTFEEAAQQAGSKGVVTGSPVRPAILEGDSERGRIICGFETGRPIVLIMGGSTGALAINNCVDEALDEMIEKYQIIHIRGVANLKPELEEKSGYRQFGYVNEELPHLLACADVVVSRAGANAIFEFSSLYKPMLLIPLPTSASRGDQMHNAKYFEKQGYAKVLRQEFLNVTSLMSDIAEVYKNRYTYETNMRSAGMGNGLEKIFEEIMKASK